MHVVEGLRLAVCPSFESVSRGTILTVVHDTCFFPFRSLLRTLSEISKRVGAYSGMKYPND